MPRVLVSSVGSCGGYSATTPEPSPNRRRACRSSAANSAADEVVAPPMPTLLKNAGRVDPKKSV